MIEKLRRASYIENLTYLSKQISNIRDDINKLSSYIGAGITNLKESDLLRFVNAYNNDLDGTKRLIELFNAASMPNTKKICLDYIKNRYGIDTTIEKIFEDGGIDNFISQYAHLGYSDRLEIINELHYEVQSNGSVRVGSKALFDLYEIYKDYNNFSEMDYDFERLSLFNLLDSDYVLDVYKLGGLTVTETGDERVLLSMTVLPLHGLVSHGKDNGLKQTTMEMQQQIQE